VGLGGSFGAGVAAAVDTAACLLSDGATACWASRSAHPIRSSVTANASEDRIDRTPDQCLAGAGVGRAAIAGPMTAGSEKWTRPVSSS
jgi:hypothetical protein